MSSDPGRIRRRDPVRSKAKILEAAREAFTERGYDSATIRDIAKRADVAVGLVLRHFTTKQELFLAAFPGPENLKSAPSGDHDSLVAELLESVLGRLDSNPTADPFLALIRSAGANEDAAAALYEEMRRRTTEFLSESVESPDRELRVELLGAQIIGIAFVRHVLRTGALVAIPAADLARSLQPIVQATLYGDLTSAPA
ncbi:MAG: TetR family transcriptional regulator [Amycolatopsis sp.]|jgi:AcrR family transcriptional regulator|uniref:TetR/AcrR family transcriptional regulator n=1 Tax=Amycolatopsis sp. TaxID=37632 RepID=UPI00262A0E5A|nr:TetR family transcriptional regulator [Amycolatopsis sp.]MCU1682011.1 TetR family transcriptional regulator [Amycolatopsis sp.]